MLIETSRLVVANGEHEGMIFPLRETIISIGRGPDNTIQIIDGRMSRNHSMLIQNEGLWYVRDLRSKNGTLLNDLPVSKDCPLCHGDRVQIGETVFQFEQDQPDDTTTSRHLGLRVTVDDLSGTGPSHVLSVSKVGQQPKVVPEDSQLSVDDANRLRIIYRVSEMTTTVLNLEELLDKILDLIQEFLAPDRIGILLYDERFEVLLPKVIRRPPGSTDEIVISHSIINQATQEHVAVLVSDAPSDYRFREADSIVVQRIHSALCVPLIHNQQVLGVLYMDRQTPATGYKQKDLNLVTGIANQSAMAIVNSRLHGRLLEQHAQDRELEIARGIQQRLLPKDMPLVPGFELYGLSTPARMVGGDYYDVIVLPDGQVLIVIADVSGKGVPASILLASVRAAVQVEVRHMSQGGLLGVVEQINQMICRDTGNGLFVTMFMALLNPATRELTYCNCGHVYPIYRRKGGGLETLETGGCLMGVVPGAPYELGQVTMDPGCALLMITDGVTDVMNPAGEMYGTGRLIEWINRNTDLTAREACKNLELVTSQFRDQAEPFDDFTVVMLRSTTS